MPKTLTVEALRKETPNPFVLVSQALEKAKDIVSEQQRSGRFCPQSAAYLALNALANPDKSPSYQVPLEHLRAEIRAEIK